ncbi:ribosomal subunit interface protein [Halioglobus japonicus]|uniref:Aromatic ring-hydroxylating dioxygenase subunit alpha n=1 Tax=Halioglobus japonicus TaxID=930805 RepID=A0AAP8MC15_9GAMM|nr:aromatic ring-hydroxylating dioxygenase subunit alpha [Halioglobus japonicus]PLW84980.1 aromatic ring-hydroxylating dioxygenase subunit alpha [Halioglobus japonicus]GHD18836.1 ribosomal subunit interface protein [Halioglobus japonicus]
MNRETATALNRRLLAHVTSGTTELADSEARLSCDILLDAAAHALERDRLFTHTPQPVAFSGELPEPLTSLAINVLDTPVLLTRNTAGQLRAFINACRHRGAQVSHGSGASRSLVCPFHGWAYDHDGALKGRPGDSYFCTDADQLKLQPLPVSEQCGVVFVSLQTGMPQADLDNAPAGLQQELKSYGFHEYRAIERREFEVAANWKLVTDLSLESYHFAALHRNSVAKLLESNAVFDVIGRHSRWAFPLQTITELSNTEESAWPDILRGSCTYTLYPGVMFVVNALGAQMIRAEPGKDPGHCRVTYAGVSKPGSDLDQARLAYEFGGDVFENEDLAIAPQCQQGIAASRADLIIGRNEPLLQFWHEQWQAAIE